MPKRSQGAASAASAFVSRVRGDITAAQYVKSINDRVEARRKAQSAPATQHESTDVKK